jgi:hypothetical protein
MIWYITGICVFSIIINIFLIWYVVGLLRKLVYVSENIGAFLGVIDEFSDHLQSLYSMEIFFGDETLRGLIEHTEFVTDEIKNFESVYTLIGYEEEQDESAETEEAEEEN